MPSYEDDSVTSPDGITHLTKMKPTLIMANFSLENITLLTKLMPTLIQAIGIATLQGTSHFLRIQYRQ